jgi:hypothetical protein
MPIQNVGTLLENLVVTEAARAVVDLCRDQDTPFEFLSALAMPPRSRWVPHKQNPGFDDAVLDKVRDTDNLALPDAAYPHLLQANLRADRTQGPNAALLVLGALGDTRQACRMWLNDVPNGHYGDAIPQLRQIHALATSAYGANSIAVDRLDVRVSDIAYPDSLADLVDALKEWDGVARAGARLGFLDPMRYRIHGRQNAETSSEDHRRWLAQLAFEGHTVAVQFTGHSDNPSLERELCALHEDSLAEGYLTSRCFKRQHYAVFFASRCAIPEESEKMAADLEHHVQRAWNSWCRAFTFLNDTGLKVYRNGKAAR